MASTFTYNCDYIDSSLLRHETKHVAKSVDENDSRAFVFAVPPTNVGSLRTDIVKQQILRRIPRSGGQYSKMILLITRGWGSL
jgi:hypothetical protein